MSLSLVQGRHARMLTILRYLQAGLGVNASELADQLEVCRRTIYRDLKTMRKAGVEMYFDEKFGCYRLSPQGNLAATPALSPEELTTLAAAVHLSALRQMPDCHDVLRQSISKLLANSPRKVQHHVKRVIKSCWVRNGHQAGQQPTGKQPEHVVHCILSAISQRRALSVTIIDPQDGQEVETLLAPYQIVAAVDTWQVVGRSSHHRRVQTFDPRLMRQPEITDEAYAIPRRYQADR